MSQQSLELECETRKVVRLVDVKLQPAELAALKAEAKEIHDEMKIKDAEFEVVKKEFQAIYKQLETKLFALIDKETDSRNEECIEKRFFENNKLEVWYGDKIIEERAMTMEERQGEFKIHHGVVMDAEEDKAPTTPEEAAEDLKSTMRDEKNPNKPSLVDLR